MLLMQRFTLIHDGSDQGWQAAYLAFHIAAQLGAPLLVLLVNSGTDKKALAQRAKQVEVGARAAGVAVETRLMTEFSIETLVASTSALDGLFVPRRLVPDGETVARFLEALSCPLWIVSKDTETYEMAVLVDDFSADEWLIRYTTALAYRTQQTLTGFIRESELNLAPKTDAIQWVPLGDVSLVEINAAMKPLDISLLFIPHAHISLMERLSMNCVALPARVDSLS